MLLGSAPTGLFVLPISALPVLPRLPVPEFGFTLPLLFVSSEEEEVLLWCLRFRVPVEAEVLLELLELLDDSLVLLFLTLLVLVEESSELSSSEESVLLLLLLEVVDDVSSTP